MAKPLLHRPDGARLARRSVIAMGALLLSPLTAAAGAQSSAAVALADFRRGLTASTSFFLNFAGMVQIATADRSLNRRERRELRGLLRSIEDLQQGKFELTALLEFYAAEAHAGNASRVLWRQVIEAAGETRELVEQTKEVAESSDALSAQLGPEEASLLNDLLNARSDLLGQLASLPPPSTEEEVAEIDAIIVQSRFLTDALRQVRTAIETELESR